MKKILFLTALLFMYGFTFANEFKFGYVDVAKIFTTTKQAKALQDALKIQFDPEQKNLKIMNDKLVQQKNQIQDIEKKVDSPDKLSTTDKNKLSVLLKDFQPNQMLFQQKVSAYQQLTQRSQDYASAILLTRVNGILKNISDIGQYDLVLTSNQLVYAKAKYDLTDQVISKMETIDSNSLVKELNDAIKKSIDTQTLQPITTAATSKRG